MENYYKKLNVPNFATRLSIRLAYKKYIKENKITENSTDEERKHFLDVREAYELLTKKDTKKLYDGLLRNEIVKIEEELKNAKIEERKQRLKEEGKVFAKDAEDALKIVNREVPVKTKLVSAKKATLDDLSRWGKEAELADKDIKVEINPKKR